MSEIISRLAIASVLLSSLAIFGCSSSDDGGGAALPTVPTGAVVITEGNAKDVVIGAIMGGNAILDAVPVLVEIEQAPSTREIIDLVIDKTREMQGSFLQSLPTAVAIDPPIPCSGGGNITGDVTETETSASGTITFNDCTESGVTLNGTITFSASVDAAGNWSLDIQGSVTGEESVIIVTISRLHINETGNDNTLVYSLNIYQYSADVTGGGGYATYLEAAVTGSEDQSCSTSPNSPRSGIIVVLGGNETKAKGTILSSNGITTVKIEFDDGSGTFVEVTEPPPGSPFPCEDIFPTF